jgi:transposase
VPKAYPAEFREKVVSAYETGKGTYAELADLFDIGEASVDRWVAQMRKTGSVAPRSRKGSRKRIIGEQGDGFLLELFKVLPDATLKDVQDAYAERFGVLVAISTIWDKLQVLGLSRKRGSSGRRLPDGRTSLQRERRLSRSNRT